MNERLRALPSVDELLASLNSHARSFPRELLVAEVRRALASARAQMLQGGEMPPLQQEVLARLDHLRSPSLRQVINATGVILHTNLGRAPLPFFEPIEGYSNLEYDLTAGHRGKRDDHLDQLLHSLLGCGAIAVNNNAAAVYLTLHELAAGREVIVSRGELIEIGDGFRIPDIMARSGAILREVGTTNRTRIADYHNAITDRTALIMSVHPSNFHIEGFTGKPDLKELTALGKERGIPVYEDLGSGCLVDLKRHGITEPLVQDSLAAGVDVVSFSTDKLLGGPQAGIVAGREDLVTRIRRNPMFRAFRIDKLMFQVLELTLRHYVMNELDKIPVLRMIALEPEAVRTRALALASQIPGAVVREGESLVGGGSTPAQTLPTWLIAIDSKNVVDAERNLRAGLPAVVARIEDDQLIVDLRTVDPSQEPELLAGLQRALQ